MRRQQNRRKEMTRWKPFRSLSTAVVAVALLVAATATGATEQKQSRGVTNIVLVHGAWADGSSWSKVIPLLEAKGLRVDAVQLPLTSQADDVATVQRTNSILEAHVDWNSRGLRAGPVRLHALVQPRGDVVPALRRRFIHPQGGTRRPVTERPVIRVCQGG